MHILQTFVLLLAGTVYSQDVKKEDPGVDLVIFIPEAAANEAGNGTLQAVSGGAAVLNELFGVLNSASGSAGGTKGAVSSLSGLLEGTVPQSPGASSNSFQDALSSLGALSALGALGGHSPSTASLQNTLNLNSALGALNGALGGGAASSGSAASIPGLGGLDILGAAGNQGDSVGSLLSGLGALGSLAAFNSPAASNPGKGAVGAAGNPSENIDSLLSGLGALSPGGIGTLGSLGSLASLGAALGGAGTNVGAQTTKAPPTTTTTAASVVVEVPPKRGNLFSEIFGEKKPTITTTVAPGKTEAKPIAQNPFDSVTKIINTMVLHSNPNSAVGNSPVSTLLAAGTSEKCMPILIDIPFARLPRTIVCRTPIVKDVISLVPVVGRSDNLSPKDEKSLMMLQELANQLHDVTFDLKEGKFELKK